MTWLDGPLVAFDLESDGVEPTEARIITAVVVGIHGSRVDERQWLVQPERPIPAEAQQIHGISTEHATAHGEPRAQAVADIASSVTAALTAGVPVIAMNARYDLTLLDHELHRLGLGTLAERCQGSVAPVLDPLVIDRHVDARRRGKRRLADLCEFYRVGSGTAHEALSDAMAAARVVWRLAQTFPQIGACDVQTLHGLQVEWHAEWAREFTDYLESRYPGRAGNEIDGAWPYTPAAVVGQPVASS